MSQIQSKPVDFALLTAGGIRDLQPYQPGKPIEELERELGITDIIKLASNENPLGPSPKVLDAVRAALKNITRYPDGFDLTAKLAKYLNVSPKQITLGNGSNQVLNVIAQTFLSPEHNAIVSAHAFIVYPIAVNMLGAQLKTIAAKNWGHDLDAMADAIDVQTRIIFIANPNNPTGTWNTGKEIRAFMQRVPANVIVVLDEAYTEYVANPAYESGMNLLAQYPNLIVTRTFSKAYGLAGLRVGYSVSSEQVANLLNRVREPFNVNSLALVAAQAALDDPQYLQKSKELNSAGMKQLEIGFRELGLDFIPSIGNFIAVEFKQDAATVYQQLLQRGVIVRPMGVYQMPKHLRISIGLPEENARCLAALKEMIGAA
jgi:histidinol-phosphate aminotransferase